ncbi:MAG: FimB/Mfa2 family fimbrial subunit, partial [Odoribacteraceae bacterium]|nr:FimB/Mfa2 family fimbrial subunit [Odoribacteraceae bacterium]
MINYKNRNSMNTSRICSLALAALAALSCADEPVGSTGNEGIETTIALSLTAAPELPGLAGTRALEEPVNEGTGPGYIVEDFWLLQFNENGQRLGSPRYYTMPTVTSTTAVAVIIPPAGKIYRCVLLANIHSDAFNTVLGPVITLADLKTVYKRLSKLKDMYNAGGLDPDLLMNGTVDVTSTTTSLTCALYRTVAKLTLTLNNTATSGVTITSVQLRNVPDRLFYVDRLLDGDAPPSPSPAQSDVFDLPVDTLDLAPGDAVETLRYYLPRNRQGTTGASTEAGKNVGAPGRATYVEIMAVTAGAIEDGGG